MKIILALICSLLLALVGYGIFCAADSWFMPYQNSTGTVIDKQYTPAYITSTYISDGNGSGYMQVHYIPEMWNVLIEIKKGKDWVDVNANSFGELYINKKIPVVYQSGRMSNMVYIKIPR